MGGAIAGVYVGGEGVVRAQSGRPKKGIRNHRSKNSPKALQAIAEKRRKIEEKKRNSRNY